MKTIINPILLALSLLVAVACNRQTDSNISDNLLTKSDSLQIVSKIIEITDDFANAHNMLDSKGILNYWHYNNPDFIIFENTKIHPLGEGIEKVVADFYAADIDSTSLNWTKRNIIPLSKEYAHLIGEYNIYLKLKTEEGNNYHFLYSALFKKINGNWKALRVHESGNTVD